MGRGLWPGMEGVFKGRESGVSGGPNIPTSETRGHGS